jgi:ABC-type uncharacterized transport system permease subunit
MLQHIIGAGVGGIITWAVLVLTTATDSSEYITAVVIGAIATILWPWVIGLFLARRVKARRNEDIQKEVDKQMAEKGG